MVPPIFYLNCTTITRIREECVEEFAEILKGIKGTGREYKDFVAGAIAGVRMAWGMDKEKKAG